LDQWRGTGGGGGASAHLQFIDEHGDRIELVIFVLALHGWIRYVY
jgi:hypothetical protein